MPISTYIVPSSRLVHETKVDFSYRSVNRTIHVVQYDKQLPIIAVTLYVGGKLYTLPATMDVNIKFGKRDRTFIYKPVLGCNADRTVVYFEMDEQMTFIHGFVSPILELSFVDGGNVQRAGSSPIAIEIERNPIQETDIESSNEYVDLNQAVADAQQAAQDAGGNYININYADLVALRDSNSLKKGAFYRITDYETTTVQAETRSAGHLFDIIVQALDEKTLSENARAVQRKKENQGELLPWFEHSDSDPAERFFYVDSVVIEGLTLYRWVSYEELNNETSPSQYLLTEMRDAGIGDLIWGYQIIDDEEYGEDYSDYQDRRTIVNVGEGYMTEPDYFDNSKLEAWELKYCLDNDTDRFVWADDVNGKGVIYRMIDEFNNDVPYDFKNIQFKRKLTDDVYDEDAGIDTWVYTFTGISFEYFTLIDGTVLKASEYFTDEGFNLYKNNKIGIHEYKRNQEDGNDKIIQQCNDIVFIGSYNEEPFTEEGLAKVVSFSYNNILGAECFDMTFGSACHSNTFGSNCYSNTIGDYFSYNIIGNSFYNNTIGNNFRDNTIGNVCQYNTIGNHFYYSTIGNYFNANTIGDYFSYNTIGNSFYSSTIGDFFWYNTIENEVSYIQFSSDGTSEDMIGYLHLKGGLSGVSSNNRLDLYYAGLYHREYPTTFEIIANGNVVSSWEATPLTRVGKVKATKTTATWSDIS